MKLSDYAALIILFLTLLSACMSKNIEQDKIHGQLNLFGIELFSSTDYREINGVKATEEPCLHGYERNFDSLDIIIGYGFNNRIRKITTLNSGTSIFGIKPGMSYLEGKHKIQQAGFTELTPPYKFKQDRINVTLLVDNKLNIFGITIESIN